MSDIDRQRIAGVRKLKALGYSFDPAAGDWIAPASSSPGLLAEADAPSRAGATRHLRP